MNNAGYQIATTSFNFATALHFNELWSLFYIFVTKIATIYSNHIDLMIEIKPNINLLRITTKMQILKKSMKEIKLESELFDQNIYRCNSGCEKLEKGISVSYSIIWIS